MEDLTGREIKGYELRELIGRGGFGVVYRAYQAAVDRDVAMKIILPEYANQPYFIRNFQFEAQIIARLEHIHIVPLYDFWRDPDGAYIIMRYLRGGSLSRLIKKSGPPDLATAAKILDQMAAALHIAHTNNVIHQDMKAANVLLDEAQNAYLTDFGIAKDLSQTAEPDPENQQSVSYGSPEYMAPEQILNVAVDRRSDIYGLGIVLFEMLTGVAPFKSEDDQEVLRQQLYDKLPPPQERRSDVPEVFNEVIWKATDKHPRRRYQNPLELAEAFRSALERYQSPDTAVSETDGTRPVPRIFTLEEVAKEPVNPFKGLRAFQESDAENFFGRKDLIETLLGRLKESGAEGRFLAVVGPSGIGKSSVVKAGVIPALRNGALVGSENWFITEMAPGDSPLDQLEAALTHVSAVSGVKIGETLRSREDGLQMVLEQILPVQEQLMLAVDQFEELFTLADDGSRRQYLDLIMNALQSERRQLLVIVTLRADFYDRPLMYPEFGELLRKRTEIVLPMNKQQLREVIERPAENAGLKLEEGLVEQIVADVSDQPGAMPLLQYALRELFENRRGITLTQEAYSSLGGVSGAMTRRADELFVQLALESKHAVRQMFLRLVALGEGTEDTRRRVQRSELLSLPGGNMDDMIEVYGRYRLLSFDNDPTNRVPTVEIGHEALIRNWQRLREWLDESRDALRLQRQLAVAAADWQQSGGDSSYLARGGRLEQFTTLLNGSDVALSKQEQEYLGASQQLHKRIRFRNRAFVGMLIVIAIITTSAMFFAVLQQRRATEARDNLVLAQQTTFAERDISRARELAVTALNRAARELDLAFLLDLQALELADIYTTRDTLLKLLQGQPRVYQYLHGNEDFVRTVDFSPDGRLLASGGNDTTIRIWDVEHGQELTQPFYVHSKWVNAVEFSPDGRLLASAGQDNLVTVIDVQSLEVIAEKEGAKSDDELWDVAFSPDGRFLVMVGEGGFVDLIEVETMEAAGIEFQGHSGTVYSAAFSPDGQLLVTAGSGGEIIFWDLAADEMTGEKVMGSDQTIRSVAFNGPGNLLVSGDERGIVRLWNVRSRQQFGDPFQGHTSTVRDVEFGTDGLSLYSAGMDGVVLVWDINNRSRPKNAFANLQLLATERSSILAMSVDPEARYIATGGHERRITLWDQLHNTQIGEIVMSSHTLPVTDLVFAPERGLLSVGNEPNEEISESVLNIWNLEARVPVVRSQVTLLEDEPRQILSTAISPDGSLIAKGSDRIMIFDAQTGVQIGDPLTAQQDIIMSLVFSSDGDYLVSGGRGGTLSLWEKVGENSWQPVGEIVEAHEDRILALAFAEDGSRIVSGSHDGRVRLWNVTDEGLIGVEDFVFELDQAEVRSVVFSREDRYLAVGDTDGVIALYDLATGAIQSVAGHRNHVTDLDFSETGNYLVSGSRDGSVIIWDLSGGQLQSLGEPLVLGGDLESVPVSSVTVSPSGTMLVVGLEAGDVLFWQFGVDSWRQTACRIANRAFTENEIQTLLPDDLQNSTSVCP